MGIMYRDVKPSNILMDSDGHVKLADLGGVMDVEGRTLQYSRAENIGSFPFAQKYGPGVRTSVLNEFEEKVSAKISGPTPEQQVRMLKSRKMSVMGTFGYVNLEPLVILLAYVVSLSVTWRRRWSNC